MYSQKCSTVGTHAASDHFQWRIEQNQCLQLGQDYGVEKGGILPWDKIYLCTYKSASIKCALCSSLRNTGQFQVLQTTEIQLRAVQSDKVNNNNKKAQRLRKSLIFRDTFTVDVQKVNADKSTRTHLKGKPVFTEKASVSNSDLPIC